MCPCGNRSFFNSNVVEVETRPGMANVLEDLFEWDHKVNTYRYVK